MRASSSTKQQLRASPNYKWYALGAVMLGTFMSPLDASIANVALPTISRAFHTPVDNTEWVLIAYMLTTSSTLVLFGRLGDLWGQKRVYTIGFAPSVWLHFRARWPRRFGCSSPGERSKG